MKKTYNRSTALTKLAEVVDAIDNIKPMLSNTPLEISAADIGPTEHYEGSISAVSYSGATHTINDLGIANINAYSSSIEPIEPDNNTNSHSLMCVGLTMTNCNNVIAIGLAKYTINKDSDAIYFMVGGEVKRVSIDPIDSNLTEADEETELMESAIKKLGRYYTHSTPPKPSATPMFDKLFRSSKTHKKRIR